MLYCKNCKKEVWPFSIPAGVPDADKIIEGQRKLAEKKKALILFNPPPMFPGAKLNCPKCQKQLEEK